VCDLETSRIGAPYIYDISRLRVKRATVGGMCGENLVLVVYSEKKTVLDLLGRQAEVGLSSAFQNIITEKSVFHKLP